MTRRAVASGVGAATLYLCVLTLTPGLEAVRLAGLPLLVAVGFIAGTVAGRLGQSPTRNGLVAASLAGALSATLLVYVFTVNEPYGVFHGLNAVVARTIATVEIFTRHSAITLGVLAGIDWAIVALVGTYAGHTAPHRSGRLLR